jgi:hypothetical protein
VFSVPSAGVYCGECGSIRLASARATLAQRLFRLVTGRRAYTCYRCGWIGYRNWTEADLTRAIEARQAAGLVESDPSLVTLDDGDSPSNQGTSLQRGGKRPKSCPQAEFDLSMLDMNAVATAESEQPPEALRPTSIRAEDRSWRVRRSRLREIVAAGAMAMLALAVVAALGVTRSCLPTF